MASINNYLLALICIGASGQEQDAIEWAVLQGEFKPKYNFDQDRAAIEQRLPELVEQFLQAAAMPAAATH